MYVCIYVYTPPQGHHTPPHPMGGGGGGGNTGHGTIYMYIYIYLHIGDYHNFHEQ